MQDIKQPFDRQSYEDFKRAAEMHRSGEFERVSVPNVVGAALTKPEALALAIRHIEHMAAWIAKQNAGYSFESLGEDMPGIRAALGEFGT